MAGEQHCLTPAAVGWAPYQDVCVCVFGGYIDQDVCMCVCVCLSILGFVVCVYVCVYVGLYQDVCVCVCVCVCDVL